MPIIVCIIGLLHVFVYCLLLSRKNFTQGPHGRRRKIQGRKEKPLKSGEKPAQAHEKHKKINQ